MKSTRACVSAEPMRCGSLVPLSIPIGRRARATQLLLVRARAIPIPRFARTSLCRASTVGLSRERGDRRAITRFERARIIRSMVVSGSRSYAAFMSKHSTSACVVLSLLAACGFAGKNAASDAHDAPRRTEAQHFLDDYSATHQKLYTESQSADWMSQTH